MAFNSYGNKQTYACVGSNVVWRKVNAVLQSGVYFDSLSSDSAFIIAAGTPIAYEKVGGRGTILDTPEMATTYASKAGYSFGYVLNDIPVEKGETYATASLVISGELYVDRLGEMYGNDNITKAAKNISTKTPMVLQISEVNAPLV